MTTLIRFFLSLFGLAIRKPAKIGESWTGYGPVNRWHDINAGWIGKLARNGIKVAHIEFWGWARYAKWDDFETLEKRYRELVRACRMYGVTLFVSYTNDNTGSGKYGDARVPLSRYLADGHIDWGIHLIKKVGKSFVWIQPVGETQTAAGRAIEEKCMRELAGFPMIYNGGSRPTTCPPNWAGFAFHPMNTGQSIPANAIVVTDTSPILIELQGDLMGSHASTDILSAYGKDMNNNGNAVIHYGFWHPEADDNSIKALKR